MGQVSRLPGAFPLHEDRDFLSESEWVILQLLRRPLESLAEADADELSAATGGQIRPERCRQLIEIVRIHRLPGLGSWIARLMVEAGLTEHEVKSLPADEVTARINDHAGYPLCNPATTRALAALQGSWRMEES